MTNKNLSSFNQLLPYRIEYAEFNVQIRETFRSIIIDQYNKGNDWRKVASILYHSADKLLKIFPEKSKKEIQKLYDWYELAFMEFMILNENSKLLPFDGSTGEVPKYYIISTGVTNCKKCKKIDGTILRQIAFSKVLQNQSEKLKDYNIIDDHTKLAIWVGKNTGVSILHHLGCKIEYLPIDIHKQYYDKELKSIQFKVNKFFEKYLADTFKEAVKKSRDKTKQKNEKILSDQRKGIYKRPSDYIEHKTYIVQTESQEGRLLNVDGKLYKEVPQTAFSDELEVWRKNRTLPIPVPIGSSDHQKMLNGIINLDSD